MFRALSFLAVLLTAAWLGSAPTLEPAASLAVALATLLYAERRHVRSLRPQASGARDTSAVDRLTLEAFLKDLPEDGPIGYFANRTCANPFDITHLYALEEAAVRCSAANREFLNPALESAKRRLLDNTAEFISFVAKNTFYINEHLHGISEYWSHDRQRQAIEQIDATAQALLTQYQEFVRLARRVLLPAERPA
jgi:hypothetical protein